MLKVRYHNQFKRDYKLALKRGCKPELLEEVVELLVNEIVLPEKYKDHKLTGNYKNFRECHIQNDWLLVYKIKKDELVLVLSRIGTHSDLF
ncbi:type II toxin-antitoxin system YafQ family toxin [Fusobacterium varium]|uniref:type II toxin-antitoxin system YafQ family toxin n=1 Tax=Fusobacterium varium TaxID=856 RepID=UPI000E40D338|nr:type II toxin-antitoxin system YafQ family toxin [Fusobacterium varium]RGJ30422.1 type II toxin-antitoxin system YafQ family toxin [Fusobacterium varium]